MQSADQEVVGALADWPEGEVAYLFTVSATWGSSPRPPGSLLAIGEGGRQVGSVSGGCVEDDLVQRVRSGTLTQSFPQLITYGVQTDEARRFGLPCGGRLDLLVERIDDRTPWRILKDALAARRLLLRRVCLGTTEASLHPADRDVPALRFEGGTLSKLFGPSWQLLIVGAGQVARHLAPIAQALDYRVIVCDPQEDVAANWDLPGTDLDRGMPDDVAKARVDDPRSALVALTHDPKLDDMALMEALGGRAFYVGALGSQGNNQRRRQRLRELGLPPEVVARLRGPVGLPLGGRTPAEIAVAVAADLTAVRHGRRLVLAEPEN